MILLDKTYEQIMEESLDELEGMQGDRNAGSVARLLLSIVNKKLAGKDGYYSALKLNHAQAFVSKATDRFLDHIGLLLDCHRRDEEVGDDEAFRYRITKQIQIVASANYTAVRLAALSVEGVQDVMMKRWTHGTGSFSVYVITENPITPQEVLDEVARQIMDSEAYGIRGEVFRPNLITVQAKIRLVFNKTVPELDRKLAIAQAQDRIREYINSRNVGEPLTMTEINKAMTEIHPGIEEVILFDYRLNDRPVLPVDQQGAWNERFIESDKPNAVYVM
jgi:uncharacterized phage protein gp47/JayE